VSQGVVGLAGEVADAQRFEVVLGEEGEILILTEAGTDGFKVSAAVEGRDDLFPGSLMGVGTGDGDVDFFLGGDVLIAVDADHLFDEIGFDGDITAPRGYGAGD